MLVSFYGSMLAAQIQFLCDSVDTNSRETITWFWDSASGGSSRLKAQKKQEFRSLFEEEIKKHKK
jgi:hypothetical protein